MLRHLARLRTAQALSLYEALPVARSAGPACSVSSGHHRSFSTDESGQSGSGSWLPSWLRNRLPGSLGGDKEAAALETMTLDSYATVLKRARQLGSLTGFVSGTSKINDPLTQGNLRVYEDIIGAMLPEEKADLATFGRQQRLRVAQQVGCTPAQVDDCLAKFEWMKHMGTRMAALKRSGQPLPKTVDEVERTIGNWRGFRQQQQQQAGPTGTPAAGSNIAPSNLVDARGRPCPLAGQAVGRNTKCSRTRKTWKSCCGKELAGRRRP